MTKGHSMLEQQKIVDQATKSIAGLLQEYARATAIDDATQKALMVFLRASLTAALTHALNENELYRHINMEMRQGLQHIYKTITSAAAPGEEEPRVSQEETGKLFGEAAEQLNEVMATTLEATENIMIEVEGMLTRMQTVSNQAREMKSIGDEDAVDALLEEVNACENSLTKIMTDLSFQDLTGQRLKKVVNALSDIQASIFKMYVSSGLMIKTGEAMPEKNVQEIKEESKRRMDEIMEVKGSALHGPSRSSSQADVDNLLADLGL